ncbi:IS1595 family transposase [Confluentibacter sediminis]|uniref:IS1595 family transposase n=1 Tax=Confluentibacter sediminis TaxID=2219045 RepID=UPI000DAE12C0|nr:IS1595 family transposase [Confluentibacter sediminis]
MNIIEISEKFPTELDAVKYFEMNRWGEKPLCAYCNSPRLSKRGKDLRFKCYECGKSTSVTVDTALHSTNMELKKWMFAFSIVCDAKKGLSALQLQRNLSISYPTALKMYHKMRDLMSIENDTIKLDDIVEMDEMYVGGKPRKFNDGQTDKPFKKTSIPKLDERISELKEVGVTFKRGKGNPAKSALNPKRGRGTSKIPVIGIVERNGDVVAQVTQNVTAKELKAMVQKYVDVDDSVLISDEYKGYSKMDTIIEHVKIDHQKLYSYKGINTNSIESFWAIIRRQIIGQHHQVSLKHLPKYVAEAVFKYNNRKIDDMFETLITNAMKTPKKEFIPNSL